MIDFGCVLRGFRKKSWIALLYADDGASEVVKEKLEDGVLIIKVPKKEQVDTSKRIMIE